MTEQEKRIIRLEKIILKIYANLPNFLFGTVSKHLGDEIKAIDLDVDRFERTGEF